jgi:hypothetical protein
MKRNQFTSLIAASLFVLVCSAQKKTTVTPQQLNHKVDLKTAATSKAKIAGIDSLRWLKKAWLPSMTRSQNRSGK